MARNTSCKVTNSRFGPPSLIWSSGVPLAMPLATAAGITAIPAIVATSVSANTMIAEFFTRSSFWFG